MKRLLAVFVVMLVTIAFAATAWAEEYFFPEEKQKIRQTVAEVLPGAKVDFTNTDTGGAGILVGPLPNGKNIFIPINEKDEIFIYQPPAEYEQAAWEIIKTVYRIVDNRPASHPKALGRNLLERQEIKE